MDVVGVTSSDDIAAARRLLTGQDVRPELDRIARLAARALGASSAQVSLSTEVQTIAGGAGPTPEAVGSTVASTDSLCAVTGACGEPLVLPDAAADPRVAGLAPVASGAVASCLGVPLLDDTGHAVGALCVFDRVARAWSPADVVLLEQLAVSAVGELERAALRGEIEAARLRWELGIAAAGIGSFDWDLRTGRVAADDRVLAMFDMAPGAIERPVEDFLARVHPHDAPDVTRGLQNALGEGGLFETEARIMLPSGSIGWVRAWGRAILDQTGRPLRLIGAATDTTRQRESEADVVRVLEAMSAGFLAVDREWRVTYVNAEAERVLRAGRGELLGGNLGELFPALLGSGVESVCRAAMAGTPGMVEAYHPAPLDVWLEVRAAPAPDGLSVYFLDVTLRRTAENLAGLATRVTDRLTGVLDVPQAAQELAGALVPDLADWTMVSVTGEDGVLRDLGHEHRDPAMRPVLRRYAAIHVDSVRGRGVVDEALDTPDPVIIESGATRHGIDVLDSPEAVDALTRLAPESAVVLSLVARGHLLGALSLCRGADRAPMTRQELQVAVDIAHRAALGLDNARLYAEQQATAHRLAQAHERLKVVAARDRTVAVLLQEAMLTRLPEHPHLDWAARYLTASGTDQVGGDWFDALVSSTGTTTMMIGDVVGHDIRAAVVMGQLRNLLRGFAWDHPDEPPSALVTRLDRAMRDLHIDTFATLAVAQIDHEPGGCDGAGRDEPDDPAVHVVRWTNAGHPPPAVVDPDGVVTFLAPGHDILLGIAPEKPRHDHTLAVPAGATLLLYTDGLIETRTSDLDAGQARLAASLGVHHRRGLDGLVTAVLADMGAVHPEDDVAVLAVRLDTAARRAAREARPS